LSEPAFYGVLGRTFRAVIAPSTRSSMWPCWRP